MVCIYCGHKTAVTNSRAQKRIHAVWRRRHCSSCSAIFTTHEQVDLSSSVVFVSKDGSSHQFDRQSLFLSLYDCLKHRPDAQAAATSLTDTVIGKLLSPAQGGTISRDQLVRLVAQALLNFDTAAAVQYNAYHRLG